MDIKHKANDWWLSLLFVKRCELTVKHLGTSVMIDRGVDKLSEDEVLFIYNIEVPFSPNFDPFSHGHLITDID